LVVLVLKTFLIHLVDLIQSAVSTI